MDIFAKIAFRIIKEQELIIGPLAWDEASRVQGLNIVNKETGEITFEGDKGEILNRLVSQYERLFGRASVEVCHDAAAPFIAELEPTQVPASLR